MGNCQDNNYRISEQKPSDGAKKAESKPERSRHSGAILGLTIVGDQIISCSDDKTIAISKWTPRSKRTDSYDEISYLTGHSRAVNRVAASRSSSQDSVCWTASRDLSIRCVSLLIMMKIKCAVSLPLNPCFDHV